MASSGATLSAIQRIMLEGTIDQGVTWSTLWTSAEVLNYLNQRISRFLLESELTITRELVASAIATVDLPGDLVALKEVSWNVGGVTKALVPLDYHQVDLGRLSTTTATPYGYILEPENPLVLRLIPTPNALGTLIFLYIAEHGGVTITPSTLPFLDMFEPYILCGVLCDMFSKEGEANDPDRAKYFGERWAEGMELAKLVVR